MRSTIKYILNLMGLLLATIPLSAQKRDQITQHLQATFLKKDAALLQEDFAENFAIAGHTHAGAKYRLEQILKSYPVTDIQFVSERKIDNGNALTYQLTKNDGTKINTQVLIDTSGKIRYIELFDSLYGMQRKKSPKLVAKIPFTNRNGSIMLQVKINNYSRPLQLLFDSGADGMAVSKSLADSIGLQVTRTNNASVVGGNMQISVSDNNTILLDTLRLSGQGIAIFPEMRKGGDGIIGNSLLNRFIVHIDYDKSELSLYEFGKYSYVGKGKTVPVKMPSGILILPGKLEIVAGKSFDGQFVFDTGAAYDLICFRPFVRKNKLLVSGFRPEAQGSTSSMGITSPTFLGNSYGFSLSPLLPMKNLPVTLMGGTTTNENWSPGFDGSIGVRLLSRYNMTINMSENEIFFAPNNFHKLPQDFIMGSYLLGWNYKGNLLVLGNFVGNDVKTESSIAAIGQYTAVELKKNPKLITELQKKAKTESITLKMADNHELIIEPKN